jgi:RNase P subunit RPR2
MKNRKRSALLGLVVVMLVSAMATSAMAGKKKRTTKASVTYVYVCPMHPQVKATKPGTCPKCHMKLVKQVSKASGTKTAAKAPAVVYICTMCPDVRASKPGKCPKCGMALVKKS